MDTNNNIYYPTNTSTTSYTGSVIINNNLVISKNCYATTFSTTSDYRIKQNQKEIDLEIYNIDNLKPKIYDNILSNNKDIGFIAHELQEEFPFLVKGEKDGQEYQNINYNPIIALLVKELQEQKKEISNLKIEIKEQKNEINNLKNIF